MLKPAKASRSEASNSSKRIYLFNILDNKKKYAALFTRYSSIYTHIDDVGQCIADRVMLMILHFSSIETYGAFAHILLCYLIFALSLYKHVIQRQKEKTNVRFKRNSLLPLSDKLTSPKMKLAPLSLQ